MTNYQNFSTQGYMNFLNLFRSEIGIPLGGKKKKNKNNESNNDKVSRTCETILTIDKDDHRLNLPLRVSLSSFKIGVPILSYGCIVCYQDTDNKIYYLCMRRDFSTSFTELIRGTYKESNLYFLLQCLSDTERKIIIDNYQNFDYLWTLHCGKTPNGDAYIHAKNKFEFIHHILLKLIKYTHGMDPDGKDLWIWPKGRIDYKYNDDSGCKLLSINSSPNTIITNIGSPNSILGQLIPESPLECALREFNEETHGCVIEESWSIFENPLCENYLGTNSKNYSTKYFIFKSPSMFEIPLRNGNTNDFLKWLTFDEIKSCYLERRISIVSKIEELFSSAEISFTTINNYWKLPIDPTDYLFDIIDK